MISVSFCASGDFYLAMNISGTNLQINLKFGSIIEKAILQIKTYTLELKLVCVTRRGRQYGSKRFFFGFSLIIQNL